MFTNKVMVEGQFVNGEITELKAGKTEFTTDQHIDFNQADLTEVINVISELEDIKRKMEEVESAKVYVSKHN